MRQVGSAGVLRDTKLVHDRAIVSGKGNVAFVTFSPWNDCGTWWISFTEYSNSVFGVHAGVLLALDVTIDEATN